MQAIHSITYLMLLNHLNVDQQPARLLFSLLFSEYLNLALIKQAVIRRVLQQLINPLAFFPLRMYQKQVSFPLEVFVPQPLISLLSLDVARI